MTRHGGRCKTKVVHTPSKSHNYSTAYIWNAVIHFSDMKKHFYSHTKTLIFDYGQNRRGDFENVKKANQRFHLPTAFLICATV